MEHVESMAKEYKADGVIHYALQFCSPYTIESFAVEVEKNLTAKGISSMRIETDYSQEDVGQLKTRVESFLELLKK